MSEHNWQDTGAHRVVEAATAKPAWATGALFVVAVLVAVWGVGKSWGVSLRGGKADFRDALTAHALTAACAFLAAAWLLPGPVVAGNPERALAAERLYEAVREQPTATPHPTSGGRLPVWLPERVSRWSDLIVEAATRHGLEPAFVAAVVVGESCGKERAVSPAGAIGLMQVMPATGAGIAQERGIAGHSTDRLYEPAYSLDFGAYYLAQQLKRFGTPELASIAYNGGPGAALAYQANGGLVDETSRYLANIPAMYADKDKPTSETFTREYAGSYLCTG